MRRWIGTVGLAWAVGLDSEQPEFTMLPLAGRGMGWRDLGAGPGFADNENGDGQTDGRMGSKRLPRHRNYLSSTTVERPAPRICGLASCPTSIGRRRVYPKGRREGIMLSMVAWPVNRQEGMKEMCIPRLLHRGKEVPRACPSPCSLFAVNRS